MSANAKVKAQDTAKVRIKTKRPHDGATVGGHVKIRIRDRHGKIRDEFEGDNLVVNQGLNYLLDAGLDNGTKLGSWYIGLINGASPTLAATDTAASHAGWSENQNYSEATRPQWIGGTVSGQSVDNVGNEAVFTIDTNGQTIGGVFLQSNSTKGSGSGSLYAEFAFPTAKGLDNGETIEVTYTFTMADDGA